MNFIKRYWLDICSIGSFGAFGHVLSNGCLKYYPSFAYGIGWIAGQALGYAFLGLLCVYFLRRWCKRKKLEIWIFCFSISLPLYTIYDHKNNVKEVAYLLNYERAAALVVKNFCNPASSPRNPEDNSANKCGDFAQLLSIETHMVEFGRRISTKIEEKKIELEAMLDSVFFWTPEYILQAMRCVHEHVHAIEDCEKQYINEFVKQEKILNEAIYECRNSRLIAATEFEKFKILCISQAQRDLGIQKNYHIKLYELLTFLSKTQGLFSRSNNGLIFEKDEDAVTYNLLVKELEAYAAESTVLMQQREANIKTVLHQLENQ